MIVELELRLGFGFEGELSLGCMGELHPSLYRGVGGVQKD
jgi:hypothetical protein